MNKIKGGENVIRKEELSIQEKAAAADLLDKVISPGLAAGNYSKRGETEKILKGLSCESQAKALKYAIELFERIGSES